MSSLEIGVAATTFLLIFPAELPDKTFVASLVLATRFSRFAVWVGVTAAFGVHCLIAVTAGSVLTLLPSRLVELVAGTLFAVGALVMLRGGMQARATWMAEVDQVAADELEQLDAEPSALEPDDVEPDAGGGSWWNGALAAFGVVFVAEWGDLSQLLTAGLAASTGDPVSVFAGAWVALACVAAIAVLAGGWLTQRVPLHRIRLISAGALAVLSVLSFVEAARG